MMLSKYLLMTKQFVCATFGRDMLRHYSFAFFVQSFTKSSAIKGKW